MPTELAVWDLTYITQEDIDANTYPEPGDPTEPGYYVFGEEHISGPYSDPFDAEVYAVQHFGFRE